MMEEKQQEVVPTREEVPSKRVALENRGEKLRSPLAIIRAIASKSPRKALEMIGKNVWNPNKLPPPVSRDSTENPPTVDLLVPDTHSEKSKHPLIKDIPVFPLSHVLQAIRSPSAMEKHSVSLLGAGAEGVVIGLKDGSEEFAVKIFHQQLSPDVMNHLLNTMKTVDKGDKPYLYNDAEVFYKDPGETERRNRERGILNQILALKQADEVQPGSAPEIKGMVTYDGMLTGYVMEKVTGNDMNVNRQNIERARENLERQGLSVDSGGGGTIQRPDGTICFVDVGFSQSSTQQSQRKEIVDFWEMHK